MAPVTWDASGPSSQVRTAAISSGSPAHPRGIRSARRSARPGSPASAWIRARTIPGATALTRILSPASSLARPTTNASSAAVEQGVHGGVPGPGVVVERPGLPGRGRCASSGRARSRCSLLPWRGCATGAIGRRPAPPGLPHRGWPQRKPAGHASRAGRTTLRHANRSPGGGLGAPSRSGRHAGSGRQP